MILFESAYSDREAVRKLAADLLDAAQARGTDRDFGEGAWTTGELRKAERDADLLSELADELEELIGAEPEIEWPEERRVADYYSR